MGGTLLVFFLGYWIKGREAREAERTRFHHERRGLYASFLDAAYQETQAKVGAWMALTQLDDDDGVEAASPRTLRKVSDARKKWNEAGSRYANLQRQLRLITGSEVVEAVAAVDPKVFRPPRRSDMEAQFEGGAHKPTLRFGATTTSSRRLPSDGSLKRRLSPRRGASSRLTRPHRYR